MLNKSNHELTHKWYQNKIRCKILRIVFGTDTSKTQNKLAKKKIKMNKKTTHQLVNFNE